MTTLQSGKHLVKVRITLQLRKAVPDTSTLASQARMVPERRKALPDLTAELCPEKGKTFMSGEASEASEHVSTCEVWGCEEDWKYEKFGVELCGPHYWNTPWARIGYAEDPPSIRTPMAPSRNQ